MSVAVTIALGADADGRREALGMAAVLLFLRNPAAPCTNNEAKPDARMTKLRQKNSGGFRTLQGAESFAVLRTLTGTAQKRGCNPLAMLALNPDQLVAKLDAA